MSPCLQTLCSTRFLPWQWQPAVSGSSWSFLTASLHLHCRASQNWSRADLPAALFCPIVCVLPYLTSLLSSPCRTLVSYTSFLATSSSFHPFSIFLAHFSRTQPNNRSRFWRFWIQASRWPSWWDFSCWSWGLTSPIHDVRPPSTFVSRSAVDRSEWLQLPPFLEACWSVAECDQLKRKLFVS